MQVGEAFVAVRPDTSKFGPQLEREVKASGTKAARGLEDLFSAQTLVGAGAVVGISKIIGASSDLNESVNKTQATFGAASGAVEAFAATSADSFGISEAAALDLAGGLGAMLIPLGTSQEEAASMSTTLLELAADMGSFNNQDPTEMLDRLRSGLAGEAEPLRQFGVTLSEARVQQFAWANGIADSGVALTEQQKIMGRYGLILEDTAVQQGDFANTADSAANAQRRAAATAADSAASLGSNFLPIYEQGVAAVQGLAGAFGALPGPVQTATVLLGAAVALKGPIGTAFGIIGDAARNMAARFTQAGGGAKGFGAALTPGALGIGAAVVGIGLITTAMANQARTAEETKNRLKSLSDAYAEGGIAAAGQTFLSQITEEAPEVLDALRGMEGGVGGFIAAIGEGGDTGEDAMRRLGAAVADVPLESWDTFMEGGFVPPEQQARIYDTVHALNLFVEPLTAASAAATELSADQEAVADATATAADRLADQVTALDEVAASADTAKDALDSLFGIQRTVAEGAIAVRDAARDLFQSFLELGEGGFRAGTAASDDFTTSMQNSLAAISDQTIAMRNNGSSIQEVRRFQRGMVEDQVALARAVGMPEAAIRRLVDTFGTVPQRVLTEVEQRGADRVQRDADQTRDHIERIPKSHDTAIRANIGQAMSAIAQARLAAEAWARMSYTAQIRVATQGIGPIQGARGRQSASDLFGGPLESGPAVAERAAFSTPVHVTVNGSIVGDVERFADEIAYRAAEKLSRSGAF